MDDNYAEFLGYAGKTGVIWENDKRTYEEVKMKNPLSFTPMMTAECRTGGHSQQIIYSTFHSFLISSICSRMLFILLRDL